MSRPGKSTEANLFLSFCLLLFFAATLFGCSKGAGFSNSESPPAGPEASEEFLSGEGAGGEVLVTDYYWPWINHASATLSSGEVIVGPDIFESDHGFIAEYTENYSYEGRITFLVEDSDVFSLTWLSLQFDVDYYRQGELESGQELTFLLEDFRPEAAGDGVQQFEVNVTEQTGGFVATIKKLYLGKEEAGSFSTEPLNYVAFDVEIKVSQNPD